MWLKTRRRTTGRQIGSSAKRTQQDPLFFADLSWLRFLFIEGPYFLHIPAFTQLFLPHIDPKDRVVRRFDRWVERPCLLVYISSTRFRRSVRADALVEVQGSMTFQVELDITHIS